jgi:hypothetical protein
MRGWMTVRVSGSVNQEYQRCMVDETSACSLTALSQDVHACMQVSKNIPSPSGNGLSRTDENELIPFTDRKNRRWPV